MRLWALLSFVIVSIAGGALIAGLALPIVAMPAALAAATGSKLSFALQLPATPQMQVSKVLLADGSPLATFYDQNRAYVPLSQIAPIMQQAQVAIEDHRFYDEGAIDPNGLLRAVLKNVGTGQTQGGSTLTQQYVKQVRLQIAEQSGDAAAIKAATAQTIARKIVEVRYALGVEQVMSKQQILEGYLNIAYFGGGAYGIQAAAQHWFGVSANELTLPQAAQLAGLVQNPTGYDPVKHPTESISRRNVVLEAMVTYKVITAAQAADAKKVAFDPSRVTQTSQGCSNSRYPFVCDYVRNVLAADPTLGATKADRENLIDRGGLTIRTSIQPAMQDNAQQALAAKIDPKDPVVATAIQIQPSTGLILSMAQSRPVRGGNIAAGQTFYNYAVSKALGGAEGYQGGSTFKIFTLAAALASGLTPDYSMDVPLSYELHGQSFKSCSGSFTFTGTHTVNNTVGEEGNMNLVQASADSINTFFTILEQQVGICATVKMAQAVGVQSADGKDLVTDLHDDTIPSFTLGVSEVTPLSMTSAYATFANRGIACNPTIVTGITRVDGSTIAVPSAGCHQAVDQNVADGVNQVLGSVLTEGTGKAAFIPGGYDLAGKTGTIDGAGSLWFDGYTPDLAGTVMIAVDKTSPYWKAQGIKSSEASLSNLRLPSSGTFITGYGGSDSAPIWKALMAPALASLPKTQFQPYIWPDGSTVAPAKRAPQPAASATPAAPSTPAANSPTPGRPNRGRTP